MTSRRLNGWLAPAAIALFVLVLWLPFGFKTTGLMEEWEIITGLARGDSYHVINFTGYQRLRPFIIAPVAVANALTPDSFLGFNLLQMTFFIGKGVVCYAILRRVLPGNPMLAFVAGILVIIFPADDALLALRAISIHGGVFFYLLSVYGLIVFWQRRSIFTLLGMWLALFLAVGTYEAAYPLILVTPLILIALERQPRVWVIRTLLLWYLVPVLHLIYYAVSLVQGADSYQTWVLQHSAIEGSAVTSMLRGIAKLYQRHLWTGWAEAISQIDLQSAFVYLGLGIAVLCALLIIWRADHRPSIFGPRRRYLWLTITGFILIGLGFVAYLPTPYREDSWRAYYYSAIGGALFVAGGLALIASWLRTPSRQVLFYSLGSGVVIFLASVHALNQHAHYVNYSLEEQALLSGIVTRIPQIDPGIQLAVFDKTGQYRDQWTLASSEFLQASLRYVYSDVDLQASLCYGDYTLPGNEWIYERCRLSEDGLVVEGGPFPTATYPYDRLVAIRYDGQTFEIAPDLTTTEGISAKALGYNPLAHVDQAAPLPPRAYTMFSQWSPST